MKVLLRLTMLASMWAALCTSAYADGLWLMALFNAGTKQVEVSAKLPWNWKYAPRYPKVSQRHMVADGRAYDDVKKGIDHHNCVFDKGNKKNQIVLDKKIDNVSVPDWCDGPKGKPARYESPVWLEIKAGKKSVRLFRCDGNLYVTEQRHGGWKKIGQFRYTSYWGVAGFVAYVLPDQSIHVVSK